ncbi:hypothetical protein [Tabrizicola sp.]|uniref:hypothetical protein n=1 Tax=Tabrizicola sp. TaxID=2005166 RepID=UPI001A54145A|nr:hypothetical protein [Tabrizicola sp.]MBL9074518.1 hypothetical protein [Tabrizicola sp.]
MVIQSVTEIPRPSISTGSVVKKTSGMDCVTNAMGRKARVKAGIMRDEMVSRKAKTALPPETWIV